MMDILASDSELLRLVIVAAAGGLVLVVAVIGMLPGSRAVHQSRERGFR